jgi:type II secretory pathway pseudopilin PulG
MNQRRRRIEGSLQAWARRIGSRFGAETGITLIETIVVMAMVGVLALITVPWMSCTFDKSHYAQVLEDMRQARTLIETYEVELGAWPPDLEAAFGTKPVPKSLIYCTDDIDGNFGHGNEFCTFFDTGNPSGNNNHGGTPEVGYILMTEDLLSRCSGVRMAWLGCCGEEPNLISWDADDSDVPGHPGDPQGNPSDSGGGNGGGGNGGGG